MDLKRMIGNISTTTLNSVPEDLVVGWGLVEVKAGAKDLVMAEDVEGSNYLWG
jgi:hypothetical protein